MTTSCKKKNVLIVGGSSGLGLKLALIFCRDHKVFITGRKNSLLFPNLGLIFVPLELSPNQLGAKLDQATEGLPEIDILIYAAGYCQEGLISDLEDEEIEKMLSVGLGAPAKILQRLLKKQGKLSGFIAITSTSQVVPRKLEPVYAAVKAGFGMLAQSISLDRRVVKTLVAAPAGMNTKLRKNINEDKTELLDPKWVAEQIMSAYNDDSFVYKHILILRDPKRVIVKDVFI